MKVGIISLVYPFPDQGFYPGIERHVYLLSTALEKKGLEVHIFTTFWNGNKVYEENNGIHIHRFKETKKVFGKIGCLFDFHVFSFCNSISNSELLKQCDVIITLTALSNIKKLKKINNKPILSFFHHADKIQRPVELLYIPFSNYIERKCHTQSDLTITPSSSSAKVLENKYGISNKKIKVIPHGLDLDTITSKFERIDNLRDIKLLYVGPIIPRKGISYLIKGMAIVKDKYPNVKLFIIGKGGHRKKYEKLSRNYGLEENIIFTGFVSDDTLKNYYKGCDVFVFPSLNEGFGQVLIEAMSFGMAIVAANSSSIPEIIGDSGILVKPKDHNSLAEAIIHLIDDKKHRDALGKKAYQRVLENYSSEKIVDEYIKLFNNLINDGGYYE